MPKQKDSEADIQGINFPSSGKLGPQEQQEFQKVFHHWSVLARRYAEHWGSKKEDGTWEEVHWWYRERTHVGLFAASVWMAGGIALEEYVSQKIGDDGRRYTGRTDLCFCLSGRDYVAEAKHVRARLPMSHQDEWDSIPILEGLRDASRNAYAAREQGYPLGLVFVTLECPSSKEDALAVTESITRWLEAVAAHPELKTCLLTSWFFPAEGRGLTVEAANTGKVFANPGTAMFFAHAETFK